MCSTHTAWRRRWSTTGAARSAGWVPVVWRAFGGRPSEREARCKQWRTIICIIWEHCKWWCWQVTPPFPSSPQQPCGLLTASPDPLPPSPPPCPSDGLQQQAQILGSQPGLPARVFRVQRGARQPAAAAWQVRGSPSVDAAQHALMQHSTHAVPASCEWMHGCPIPTACIRL